MPHVISTGTADAPFRIPQNEVKKFVYELFSGSAEDIDRMISIFDNSAVAERHFSAPVEWFGSEHSFAERNNLFVKTALELSEKAINKCLNKAGMDITGIDHVIFVTSTGLATPTIDALLFNKINFNNHVKRTPIWGLGCAGGAAGLSRAMDYAKAYPGSVTLLISVELCSLTFIKNDFSKSNIVASSLFSDGTAAVLVAGDEAPSAGKSNIEILNSLSTIYDDSIDVMGWEIADEGLKVIFSKDIPSIVKNCVKPNIMELLDASNLDLNSIKHFVTHPGGLKVINAYEQSLGLSNGKLDLSRKVLNEHGNMSSPSVIYVLDEFLTERKFNSNEYGLISSLGPGFSSELILFKTL
jgi:alkylresorcinol/alkylpyrone synthase